MSYDQSHLRLTVNWRGLMFRNEGISHSIENGLYAPRTGEAMNVARTGIILGAVIAGWHLCWSLLVASGQAQPVIDFVFWIHFIKPIYLIEPFEFMRATILVCVTAIIGFLIGSVFALVWNTWRTR